MIMKFRAGQLIVCKGSRRADRRVIGYEYSAWLTYQEWCRRAFGSAQFEGTITELRPIPVLVLGEAIQITWPDPESRESNWIEILYGEQRLVVAEERFEAL